MRLASILLLLTGCGTALSATVTFEEADVYGTGSTGQQVYNPGTSLESGGLMFSASPTSNNIHVNGKEFLDARSYLSFANNGSNTLASYTNNGDYSLQIESAETEYFSVTSVDLAEYGSTSFPSILDSVLIEGQRYDGSLLSVVVQLDNIVDGAGGLDDFQTYIFDNSWSDLAWLRLGPADGAARNIFYVDNVVYQTSAIPIPAAAWLFGSALAGLGWMRRNQTV